MRNPSSILYRCVAVVQIIGALLSIIILIPIVKEIDGLLSGRLLSIVLVVISLFAILSATWLWNLQRRGMISSMLIYSIQVPIVYSSALVYKYIVGFGLMLKIVGPGPVLFLDIGTSIDILMHSSVRQIVIGVNYWALFVTLLMWRAARETRTRPDL